MAMAMPASIQPQKEARQLGAVAGERLEKERHHHEATEEHHTESEHHQVRAEKMKAHVHGVRLKHTIFAPAESRATA